MTARFLINPAHGMLDTVDLPTLTGTEKQVVWAEDIRATRLSRIARDYTNMYRKACEVAEVKGQPIPFTWVQAVEKLNVKHAELLSETSAKAWIDRR